MQNFASLLHRELRLCPASGQLQLIYHCECLDARGTQFNERIARIGALCETLNVPTYIKVFGGKFWSWKQEMWNWYDPDMPGFDPRKKNIVEWSDWETPVKRVEKPQPPWAPNPFPCLANPTFRRESRRKLAILGRAVAAWQKRLQRQGREDLFLGIGLDGELSILWPREGYRALMYRGYSQENPPEDPGGVLRDVVHDHVVLLARTLQRVGIPKEKIFSHEIDDGPGPVGYLWSGVTPHCQPGWSFYGPYARNIRRQCPAHLTLLAREGWPHWTAGEFAAGIFQPREKLYGIWRQALETTLQVPGCRGIVIYHYTDNKDLGMRSKPEIHRAIRDVLLCDQSGH